MPVTLVYKFDVTIPAGTPKASPLTVSTAFEPNTVESVEWLFPPGCGGNVGIQIGARSVQVLPKGQGQFFIRSGDSAGIDLSGMHDTGDWSVIGYNTGLFAHTIHVTFKVHRTNQQPPPEILIVPCTNLIRLGEG